MSNRFSILVLSALASVASGCDSDPCKNEGDACVVLHVTGSNVAEIDQLGVTIVSGAPTATRRTPEPPSKRALPIDVALVMTGGLGNAIELETVGYLNGSIVGVATTTTIPANPTKGTRIDVRLVAGAPSVDLGDDGGKVLQALGVDCTTNEECESGHCVDGVCCADECRGQCRACNLPGAKGTCTLAPSGVNVRSSCADDGTPCGLDGTCDGQGSCRFKQPTVVCAQPSCTNGVLTRAATCDGRGACGTPSTRVCDPFVCKPDGTDCYNTCTAGSAECKPPNVCNNGSCGPKPLGAMCTAGTECASGKCTDGVCCNADACDPCKRCNVTGVEGTCQPIGAGVTDARCNGAPPSAAGCGNTGRCTIDGLCEKWPAGTVCVAGSCDNNTIGGIAYPARTCSAQGVCLAAPAPQPCNGYSCTVSAAGQASCGARCGACSFDATKNMCVVNGSINPFQCAAGYVCGSCRDTASPCTNGRFCVPN
jgi:hypothetical protein